MVPLKATLTHFRFRSIKWSNSLGGRKESIIGNKMSGFCQSWSPLGFLKPNLCDTVKPKLQGRRGAA